MSTGCSYLCCNRINCHINTSLEVKLDGKIILTNLALKGSYSFNNGYDFALVSAEKVDLKITTTCG